MSTPARRADDRPAVAEAPQPGPGSPDPVAVDLEALLDQLVRELFTVGLGVAGALRQVEGGVAERLTVVLDDADRLIRAVHSAAATLRTDPYPLQRREQPAGPPATGRRRRRTDVHG